MKKKNPVKIIGMKAQTMVEFAASLMLLLTILYGLLETGRLLFIYASTVTAARQAARYGSATGLNPDGIPYYEDCDGIKAAANKVGFINDFQSINIAFDRNFDENGNGYSVGSCGAYTTPQNGDRIVVDVTAVWEPVVSFVPLPSFVIQKQSARTILSAVAIAVTALPESWSSTGSGFLEIAINPTPTTYTSVGQSITVNFILTNIGSDNITGPFTVQSVSFGVTNCGNGTLAPGDSVSCTEHYIIAQEDIDNGSKTFLAAGLANAISYSTATATISAIFQPEISLAKSPSTAAESNVGANITYTYTITNTGNVTLENAFSVSDNKISGGADCSGAVLPLAPGASTTCTAIYTVTNSDRTNGSIVNQAVANTNFNSAVITSNTATATVYTTDLVLFVSPSTTNVTLPNQVITYTYNVQNSSSTAINGLSISDDKVIGITCNSTSIAAGGSTTCTGTYTLTQADYDAGGSVIAHSQASGNNGAPVSSSPITTTVTISQIAEITAVVSASPIAPTLPATTLPVNTPINYSYTLTNSGNVTLTGPFTVTDNTVTLTCPNQAALAPGDPAIICTGTHNVTTTDYDNGSIVNIGHGSAAFGATPVQSADASTTVITYAGARFKLTLAANPTTITKPNQLVVFTYTLKNTGGKNLTSPFSITSSLFGTFDCAATSPILPGTSASCQNNMSSSHSLTNTITAASAYDGATLINATAPLPSITVTAAICNSSNLILSSPSGNGTYTWTLTNTTNYILTLKSISVQWNTAGNKYLHTVTLNSTTTIFDGSVSVDDKDGTALYNGTWTINTGINTLVMQFTANGVSISNMTLTFDEGGCGPLEKH